MRSRLALFIASFIALSLALVALAGAALAQTTDMGADIVANPSVGAAVSLIESKDWVHLLALSLGILSILPRALSSVHLEGSLKGVGDKLTSFWHSGVGIAILTFAPPVLTLLGEQVFKTGLSAMPLVTALITAVAAQITPAPKAVVAHA